MNRIKKNKGTSDKTDKYPKGILKKIRLLKITTKYDYERNKEIYQTGLITFTSYKGI